LEGKHKSMFDFAKTTWKELGIASIYRGIGLTLIKVCGKSCIFDCSCLII